MAVIVDIAQFTTKIGTKTHVLSQCPDSSFGHSGHDSRNVHGFCPEFCKNKTVYNFRIQNKTIKSHLFSEVLLKKLGHLGHANTIPKGMYFVPVPMSRPSVHEFATRYVCGKSPAIHNPHTLPLRASVSLTLVTSGPSTMGVCLNPGLNAKGSTL